MILRTSVTALALAVGMAVFGNAQGMAIKDADLTQWQSKVPAPVNQPYPYGTMRLQVDTTDTTRRIFKVRQDIPVRAGPLTLLYPKWLPGNHAPNGPINKVAGIRFRAGNQTLQWKRDPYDVYAFHLEVPQGVTNITAEFEYLSPSAREQGRITATQDMLNLQWNAVALYPAGYYVRQISVQASVKYPQGFTAATALSSSSKDADNTVRYETVPFDTLIDSPVYAGRYFKSWDLDPGSKTPVRLNVVADAPEQLEMPDEALRAHRALVTQAYKAFGSHHYDHYEFLLSLSDQMGGNGLEHHRSSENGHDPDHFTNWKGSFVGRDLLAHEFAHSWDGKFRRGADLTTPDYNTPMGNTLLWVYEGQTQFWGNVLAARSGLVSQDQAKDAAAIVVSTYADERPGFGWRSIADTTFDPIINKRSPQANTGYQLSEDYYRGGQMVWLAVHAKIAELTGERKGIDEFARAFFGVDSGSWDVRPYTFEDVVATLNSVAPFDWATFLRERIDGTRSPADGIIANGWRLAYRDKPNDYQKAALGESKTANFALSLGMNIATADGRINSVVWDGPAFNAGLGIGQTLLAVNGMAYTKDRLETAVRAKQPIRLVVRNGEVVRDVTIDYRGGLRYPVLERIPGTPDRLSALLAPR